MMNLPTSSALGLSGEARIMYSGMEMYLKLCPRVASPNYYTHFLVDNLAKLELGGKVVLDVGSGTGIISILALTVLGASSVWAVDADAEAVELTLENCVRNGCPIDRIHCVQSDIRELQLSEELNVIIANPPQTPTPGAAVGPCSGGHSGREVMEAILSFASPYVKRGAYLAMTAADFVGKRQLVAHAHSLGMSTETIARRAFQPGPYTLSHRAHIERSDYAFSFRHGKPYFNLDLLKFGAD